MENTKQTFLYVLVFLACTLIIYNLYKTVQLENREGLKGLKGFKKSFDSDPFSILSAPIAFVLNLPLFLLIIVLIVSAIVSIIFWVYY